VADRFGGGGGKKKDHINVPGRKGSHTGKNRAPSFGTERFAGSRRGGAQEFEKKKAAKIQWPPAEKRKGGNLPMGNGNLVIKRKKKKENKDRRLCEEEKGLGSYDSRWGKKKRNKRYY